MLQHKPVPISVPLTGNCTELAALECHLPLLSSATCISALCRDAAIDHHSMGSTESASNRISSRVSTIVAGLGVISLAEVRLQEGESIENALRRFKRKVQTEDIIKEVKRHSFYLKPGAKRRVKQALARKRARKKVRKESE
jgi:small subunit ribosomal protein S21